MEQAPPSTAQLMCSRQRGVFSPSTPILFTAGMCMEGPAVDRADAVQSCVSLDCLSIPSRYVYGTGPAVDRAAAVQSTAGMRVCGL